LEHQQIISAQWPAAGISDPLHRVAGLTAWIISDSKAGNDVQLKGVAEALKVRYELKAIDPTGVWRLMSPWGPVNPAERFGSPQSTFRAPWPTFVIAIGRLTTPYIRAVKRHAGAQTFTIILQDPKVSASAADVFWVPEHDRRRGPNVITTPTAPHGFTTQRLDELAKIMPAHIATLPRPRVSVSLGGPNGDYTYTQESLARLIAALQSLRSLGAGLMITPSRRTPADIAAHVREHTTGPAVYFWDGTGENPYPYFLAHADAFIVPADSVNMTGEPCATGKPVYVFEAEGGSEKFTRYHAILRNLGATRPMPARFEALESWAYTPINSAEIIAREIAMRWLRTGQALPHGDPRDLP
jgi:mitochondrial fission protein ELM1